MELKVDIAFDELMQAIKHLPEDQLSALKSALSSTSVSKSSSAEKFRELLLHGPVMSDEQYKTYKENKKHFNEWRSK